MNADIQKREETTVEYRTDGFSLRRRGNEGWVLRHDARGWGDAAAVGGDLRIPWGFLTDVCKMEYGTTDE